MKSSRNAETDLDHVGGDHSSLAWLQEPTFTVASGGLLLNWLRGLEEEKTEGFMIDQ